MPSAHIPATSSRTAAPWGSTKRAPGRQASIAAFCAASTTSYSARWSSENVPFTGNVRVTSEA